METSVTHTSVRGYDRISIVPSDLLAYCPCNVMSCLLLPLSFLPPLSPGRDRPVGFPVRPFIAGSVPNGLRYTPCGQYTVYPLGSVVAVSRVRTGHPHVFLDAENGRDVSCLAVSKDGRFLACGHETTGTTKAEAVVWNLREAVMRRDDDGGGCGSTHTQSSVADGRLLLHRLHQHRGMVRSLDFSFDGSFLVTLGGQDDNDLVVWDVSTGAGICGSPAAPSDTSRCVKFLNGRNDRFVSCGNYHLRVWQFCASTPRLHAENASSGTLRRVMQSLDVSSDDRFAFAGTKTGEVLMYGIDRDEIQTSDLDRHNRLGVDVRPALRHYSRDRFSCGVRSVTCVVNPDTGNTNIIAGAGDGTVQLLNPSLEPIVTHRTKLSGAVTSLSLCPWTDEGKGKGKGEGKGGGGGGTKKFLAGTELSQRYSLDISSFTPKLTGTCHYGEIHDVKFPRGTSDLFVTASVDDIRVWNARGCGGGAGSRSTSKMINGKRVAAAATGNTSVTTPTELMRIRIPNLTCFAVDVTDSGGHIISGWSDGKIRAFLPESGASKFVVQDAHDEGVTALAYCPSPDGRDADSGPSPCWRIVSGGNDGRVRLWRVTESHRAMTFSVKEHRGPVNAVVCNADGTRAVSASSDGSCITWDLNRGGIRVHALFEPTVFRSVLYHPDESQYVTCGADCKIGYWDAFDGEPIRTVEGGRAEVTCLDVAPGGDRAGDDAGDYAAASYTFDSTLLVSGGADRLVRVWDYDDGVAVGTGRGHGGSVRAVAVSPDRTKIVSVGDAGGIFVWSLKGVNDR